MKAYTSTLVLVLNCPYRTKTEYTKADGDPSRWYHGAWIFGDQVFFEKTI